MNSFVFSKQEPSKATKTVIIIIKTPVQTQLAQEVVRHTAAYEMLICLFLKLVKLLVVLLKIPQLTRHGTNANDKTFNKSVKCKCRAQDSHAT